MRRLPSLIITDRHECRYLLFHPLNEMWEHLTGRNAGGSDTPAVTISSPYVVVVDANVLKLHKKTLEATFPPESNRYFELPPGEQSKNVTMWNRIIDFAFSGSLRRNTALVAIGGGVTGDLAGFAAASLMRGLPLFHVPTTLLAMVDSAIGGKTGVNHAYGKNTIGAFYHPEAVLFDIEFLETLPEREWRCGISEILKYGYIYDPQLLEEAVPLADPRTRNSGILRNLIGKSVRIKSEMVAEDARESGKRTWLNFGHTFAHALETLDGYRNINHGEAVYAGMIAALYVSRQQGAEVSDKPLISLKKTYNLNPGPHTNRIDELVTLMDHDKKNTDLSVQLVLLERAGRPFLKKIENREVLKDAWRYTFNVLKPS